MTATTRSRLAPDERRSQLLDLGVRLLATRSLDELSIDLLAEEAGISRGLLYHYFGNKHAFHEAVVRRAADDLIAQTAPPAGRRPAGRGCWSRWRRTSTTCSPTSRATSRCSRAPPAATRRCARSTTRSAACCPSGSSLEDAQGELIADTPRNRLVVRGWSAMTEELVITWGTDRAPPDVTRDELLDDHRRLAARRWSSVPARAQASADDGRELVEAPA